jgi:succinate dehydrogenase/fumarate reductase flavoprotein subunit/NAD-dependent dihydropyrimidine dehydrogenase PreA subunit
MAYQINQPFCSGCHRCKMVCPVGAVRMKNEKYWIDPEKCIGCGKCAKNCHNGVISDMSAPAAAPQPHPPIEKSCDLLVIGAGGSGMVCAVKAAELTGKKVIVLEKNKEVGGNTWFASGFKAHYSKLQKEAGVPDNREEEIRRFLQGTLQQEDPQLIHNVFYATEHMLDWLMENCDCAEDFSLKEHPMLPGEYMVALENKTGTQWKRIDTSIGPGGAGSFVIEKLTKKAAELGVEILTGCGAKKLLQDARGAVSGAVAEDAGGKVTIHAKAVVLATGCFSYDDELVERCCPGFFDADKVPVHRYSVPTCTGDGIHMAIAAGADIDYENTQCLILGPAHHPFSFSLVGMIREPETLLVNRDGKRFGSEQDNVMGLRKIMPTLPGRYCWAIMDEHMMQVLSKRLTEHNMDGAAGMEIAAHYKEDLAEELALGVSAKQADTLEELAEQIGADPAVFKATVECYNDSCHAGYDQDYFKDPRFLMALENGPYYALYCKTFQENAVGGMKIDSKVRVLRADGTAIPNLFGVGDNTRGVRLAGDLGPDLVERTISNLTWCLASGYMAAENAAELI